jgi:molecular chaperone DnaK (HSP70)
MFSPTDQVYEGEDKDPENNHLLGTLVLSGIQDALKGIPKLMVDMHVDSSSLLHVQARDITTNATIRTALDRKGVLTPEELKQKTEAARLSRGEEGSDSDGEESGGEGPEKKKAKIHIDLD